VKPALLPVLLRSFNPLVYAPVLWLKADAANYQDSAKTTLAAADADPVGAFADQSGNGKDGLQATAGKRGLLKLNIQNGRPVVRLDGVDDWYVLTGLTHASGPRTVFAAVGLPDYSAATLKYLFDSATGRLILAAASDVAAQVGWFDGAWKKPGTPATTTGFQVLTWDLQTGTGEMLRNGTSLGTAAYTNVAIGGAVGLGASSDGAGSFSAPDIGEFLIYPALTVAQRNQVISYLRARWGV
jgi:hypothetical protein